MLLQIAFALMLVLTCGYAAAAGGKPGRYCALLFMVASLATMIPTRYFDWRSTFMTVFGIDTICFFCLFLLAMRFNRGWLIWCAGLQLAAITTHMATVVAPDFSPSVYQGLTAFWSIPILLVMAAGIVLDQKFADQTKFT